MLSPGVRAFLKTLLNASMNLILCSALPSDGESCRYLIISSNLLLDIYCPQFIGECAIFLHLPIHSSRGSLLTSIKYRTPSTHISSSKVIVSKDGFSFRANLFVAGRKLRKYCSSDVMSNGSKFNLGPSSYLSLGSMVHP